MSWRVCGSVRAGVFFFPATSFVVEEPGRDQRQRLMMMPAVPAADLVVAQSRFTLAALQAIIDLAQATAPLPLYPHRLAALLREPADPTKITRR